MRNPVTAIAGHVLWTRSGGPWALLRLHPLPYGLRPEEDKRVVRALHAQLLRSLRGDAVLLGLAAPIDATSVVSRMLDRIDVSRHRQWAQECDATLGRLAGLGLSERTFWLAAPLSRGAGTAMLSTLGAAAAEVGDQLGLPRWVPSNRQISEALAAADTLRLSLPAAFGARGASAAEMAWFATHAMRRGLPETPLPDGGEPTTDTWLRNGATRLSPVLDEGGASDAAAAGPRRRLARINPLSRRYLKVTDGAAPGTEPQASYQVMLTLDDVPAAGMSFPGSEFLGRLDESGVDADWAVRLTVRSAREASARIRRAVRDLSDQYDQRDAIVATGTHALDRAAADLTDYERALTEDANEVACEATIVFTVAGPTAAEAQSQARRLAQYFTAAEYRLGQPVGAQETLWWAQQPGVPTTLAVRQLAQITTAANLSVAVPVSSVALGDRRGLLLGVNITDGRLGPVLLDLEAAATEQDVSPAMAIAGSLGSGKSVTEKVVAGGIVDRGGRLLAVDRSQVGEWSRFAEAVTDATVVSVLAPRVSLDPLRLFPGRPGARITQSFLATLLDITPSSDDGRLLADVLDPMYLAKYGLSGLGELTAHVAQDCDLPGAPRLASLLRSFARHDVARVVFEASLPVVDLVRCPAVVFATTGVQLPTREELLNEHLFRQMRLERVFGRAVYALIMGIIRHVAFADPTEMVAIVLDEAHHVTASPEAEHELIELIRDGRKHKAATILGSHDPLADFGNETLRGLIATRLVGRQSDPTLARRSLAWLGLDPDDRALLDLLVRHTSPVDPATGTVAPDRRGEMLMRDSQGRLGRVKVLLPASPARAEAILTTPGATRGVAVDAVDAGPGAGMDSGLDPRGGPRAESRT